ncbi:recombination-associated protein RdgC [Thauera humireducens]|uniref:Recombination-associated protein RdgC n=1 Tax=Thauera humireducens TaxID=1134435 RepID=A0A127K3V7_9RHOO|nr:recombination-associated protein RdgC [Thauera humireducens]AMO36643.1 recombination-associated protein RdgC [Thauera humireducens]
MYFKNAQIYRLSPEWPIALEALHEQLAKRAFTPCGSQDTERCGWIEPYEGAGLVHAVGDNWMVCMQTETKLLPAAVVQQEAERRAVEIAEQQGYKLGRKQMKELREQITQELLPRAFTRSRKTFAWINVAAGWLVIDAASQSKAEDVLEQLRHTLDTFPVSLLRTERSPMSAMAGWLAGEAPEGFTIDQDFALQSVSEDRARATFKGHDPDDVHVTEHLEAGRLPIKLAMTYDDRISFTLTECGEIKRLDFLDVVRDQARADDHDDAMALFSAEFALMTGELLRLLAAIVEAMGGEIVRDPDLVDQAKEKT